jgi:excisionase family DNA binding protein
MERPEIRRAVERLVTASVPTVEEFAALQARVEELERRIAAQATQPEWLTISAASDYLGLSEDATRKLVDRRAIPKNQEVRGGRVLIARADLDRALTRTGITPEGRTR